MKLTKLEMEALAEKQLKAYNSLDLEVFCSCYHLEVEIFRSLGQPASTKGLAQFKEIYRDRFEKNPNLKCTIKSRIVLENSVIDEEVITGLIDNPEELHVVAIYGFRDRLISQVWFAN